MLEGGCRRGRDGARLSDDAAASQGLACQPACRSLYVLLLGGGLLAIAVVLSCFRLQPILRPSGGLRWTPRRVDSQRLQIQIFGLFNTGTNLLQTILHAAFPGAAICPDTSVHKGEKTCVKIPAPHWKISKHSNPTKIRQWLADVKHRDVHAIFIVRDPFSNLVSDRHHGYGLYSCVSSPKLGKRWLRTPCRCSAVSYLDPVCEPGRKAYSSAVEVWNTYTMGALELSRREWPSRSARILLIRYEDLVQDPASILAKASKIFNRASAEMDLDVQMNKKTKRVAIGQEEAARKIEHRSYMADYDASDIDYVCKHVDLPKIRALGYGRECARR